MSSNVLHQAIIDQNVATVKRILQEESSWRPTDYNGETVLHLAFKCKHRIFFHQESIVEILECFINEGLSIDLKNAAGRTVLFSAIENRLQYVTDFLVEHGANVNALDQNGNSIVHLLIEEHFKNYLFRGPTFQEFIEQEQIDSLTWLLSTGVSVHLRNNDGMTAFNIAIRRNLKHILPTLIKHMNDVDYIVKDGSTILKSLFKTKASINTKYDIQIVDSLLIFIDQIDSKGNPLVHTYLKSYGPNPEIVKKMLERYKNVNAQDNDGNTALHLVVRNSHIYLSEDKEHTLDFVRTLLSKGADVHFENKKGKTAVRYAIQVQHVEVLEALLEYGANVSPIANPKALFLHKISNVPSIEDQIWAPMVDTLVRAGWNVNEVRPSDGFTPLMEACRSRCPAIAQKLINNGANANCVEKRKLARPIHMAMVNCTYRDTNTETFFKMLAKAGANVNAKNKRGQTALHLVPICGYTTMKNLLKLGANFEARDKAGRLPMHEAIKKKDNGAIKALLQIGATVNDVGVLNELKKLMMIEHTDDEIQVLTGRDFNFVTEENKATVNYLLQHWLRLKAANLPAIDGFADFAKKDSLQEFYVECLREVESMKKHHLNDRITLYDVVQMDINLKYAFIGKRLKELVESPLLKTTFPKYRLLIMGYYYKAKARSPLIEPAKQAWDYLTGIRLPDCVEKILTYLNNEDLRVMAEEEANVITFKRPLLLILKKSTKKRRSK